MADPDQQLRGMGFQTHAPNRSWLCQAALLYYYTKPLLKSMLLTSNKRLTFTWGGVGLFPALLLHHRHHTGFFSRPQGLATRPC
jgi:hypothetical protein